MDALCLLYLGALALPHDAHAAAVAQWVGWSLTTRHLIFGAGFADCLLWWAHYFT